MGAAECRVEKRMWLKIRTDGVGEEESSVHGSGPTVWQRRAGE